MKYAKAVIGNSSSGIVEAPSLGIPTVNIGDRQKGRMLAKSVISCKPIFKDIRKAIEKSLLNTFQNEAKHVISPFGDGTTSEQIELRLLEYLRSEKPKVIQHFYDIRFDVNDQCGKA